MSVLSSSGLPLTLSEQRSLIVVAFCLMLSFGCSDREDAAVMTLNSSPSEDMSHLLVTPTSAAKPFDFETPRDYLPDPTIDWTPNPCILLKPIRIPAEVGEEGALPMLPAQLCDGFPEITVPLEPYTDDFDGVVAQILRPNSGYSLDVPDIAYIGGDPMLIQNPREPVCNESGKPMRFLFQFGEVVPGVQMADAGVFYVYGCDDHPDCCKGVVDSH